MNFKRQKQKKYSRNFVYMIFSLLLSSFLLSACTFFKDTFGISETTDLENPEYKESEIFFKEKSYALDDLKSPSTPQDLILSEQRSLFRLKTIEYEFEYSLENEELRNEFEINNILAGNALTEEGEEKKNTISAFALEKYVKDNEDNILTFLQSKGYYSAQVSSEIDYDVFPVKIHVTIVPNDVYTISKAGISYPNLFKKYVKESIDEELLQKHIQDIESDAELAENQAENLEENLDENTEILSIYEEIIEEIEEEIPVDRKVPALPRSLFEFGIKNNAIAQTEAILEAEKNILPWFRNHGFPFAQIVFSRYFAFQDKKEFETIVRVNPKDFVLFGDIVLEGSSALSLAYIETIKTWNKGEIWNEEKVELLQSELFSLGIFSHVSIMPVKVDTISEQKKLSRKEREQKLFHESDEYIVKISLKDSTSRSFGGGLAYNTSRGIGVKVFWEHRNLFEAAENISLNFDYWEDLQRAVLTYTMPDVFVRNLDFNTSLIYEKEVFDAYTTTSFTTDVGFEQPIENEYFDNLRLSYYLQAVVGNEHDRRTKVTDDYYYFGTPIRVSTRETDSALDPSKGYAFNLQFSPYFGEFRDSFSVFQLEGSIAAYFELLPHKKLVAAMRGKIGALFSEDVNNIPPPLRFYAGGANSVRGYSYQSLGPENAFGEPLGGASLFEASFELRYKFNEDISIVPFLDMGNVYNNYEIDFTEEFKFGTGIGLRYYTLAGPLRLDIAVPFDDKNGFTFEDFQVYISIGQAF